MTSDGASDDADDDDDDRFTAMILPPPVGSKNTGNMPSTLVGTSRTSSSMYCFRDVVPEVQHPSGAGLLAAGVELRNTSPCSSSVISREDDRTTDCPYSQLEHSNSCN